MAVDLFAIEGGARTCSSNLLPICYQFGNKIFQKIFELDFYESLILHLASKKLFWLVQYDISNNLWRH